MQCTCLGYTFRSLKAVDRPELGLEGHRLDSRPQVVECFGSFGGYDSTMGRNQSATYGRWLMALWCVTGLPLLPWFGWLWAKEWAADVLEKGSTLGEHTGEGTWGAVLDLFGGLGATFVAAPILLLGPVLGLILALLILWLLGSRTALSRAMRVLGRDQHSP